LTSLIEIAKAPLLDMTERAEQCCGSALANILTPCPSSALCFCHARETFTVLICLLVFGFNSLSAQQAATTRVTLTVTDPTGERLQIRVVPTPNPAPKMETDEKGKLSLDLKPGGYALFARLSGF
jgi:hypothetical protein